MNTEKIYRSILEKQSFLCVGLDSDITKMPASLKSSSNPVFEFNKKIIEATAPYTISYKPNIAFYESMGVKGWETLQMTANYIKTNYPDIFLIADAKRGDIGNTSKMYARAFFEEMNFDAITVAPYMGEDSVMPFLEYENKTVIVLALTSNKGAFDFQLTTDNKGTMLFEKVLETSKHWGNSNNLMYVVGATKADYLSKVRAIVPNHFLLIPGVGAQGGSLEDVARYGKNAQCGLIVNSSREIIYASSGDDFAEAAAKKAMSVQQQMSKVLSN